MISGLRSLSIWVLFSSNEPNRGRLMSMFRWPIPLPSSKRFHQSMTTIHYKFVLNMFGKICISTGYMIIIPGKSLGKSSLGATLSWSVNSYKEEICWPYQDSNPGSSSQYRSLWYFIWKTSVGGNVFRRVNRGIMHYRISHFSSLAGKYSHILGCSNQQD